MQKSNSPLLMLQPINATPILPSTSKTEQPTNPSYVIASGLRTDNVEYNKFNSREKKLILTIYNVIDQTLNNEKEREALIDKIEKYLKQIYYYPVDKHYTCLQDFWFLWKEPDLYQS